MSPKVVRAAIYTFAVAMFPIPMAGAQPSAGEACSGCHTKEAKDDTHASLSRQHQRKPLTCMQCHGGAAAQDKNKAHAKGSVARVEAGVLNYARCAECHVRGEVEDVLAKGAETYLELGCPQCHRIGQFGVLRAEKPLDEIGLRGSEYLTKVLDKPTSEFLGTFMPSYAHVLKDDARAGPLLAFLLSLRGPVKKPEGPVAQACASCHRGGSKEDSGFRHACRLLEDERSDLSCVRCHPSTIPPGDDECLYIGMRRKDCGVCH